jgi:hypothetical protein
MLHPAALVLFVLAEQLLLVYKVVLISPEAFDLLIDLVELVGLLLPFEGDLVGLLLAGLFKLGQVRHQPVVLLFVKLELLLLRLRRALLLLQLHCILMHGIPI